MSPLIVVHAHPSLLCDLDKDYRKLCFRDECVTAYMPDHQWDLLQQSLAAHSNGTDARQIPTAVVVEAGILVCCPPWANGLPHNLSETWS